MFSFPLSEYTHASGSLDEIPISLDTVETNENSDEDFLLEKGETAYHVYKAVWKEFYNWEQVYCLQLILELSKPETSFEVLSIEDLSVYSRKSDQNSEWFFVENWDIQMSLVSVDELPLQVLLLEEILDPYPHYTACTPGSINIQCPKNLLWTASFNPFADDERFEVLNYLSKFYTFGWQTDFWDPDREMIFIETARRLHYTYKFSYLDIDTLHMYHLPLRRNNSQGLIWDISQRDQLLWPGAQMSMLSHLPSSYVDPNMNIYDTVMKDAIAFCDNLNCLCSYCKIHDLSHPIPLPKPMMTGDAIKLQGGPPCDGNCYKLYLEKYAESELSTIGESWSEVDVRSITTLAPDTSPCDLAIICRKSCAELYIYHINSISNEIIKQKTEHTLLMTSIPLLSFMDNLSANLVKQCYHPGPCNQSSNCTCYNNHQHCQRTCRCSNNCNLKYKGCQCNGPNACMDNNCLCQRSNRECDPEVCLICDARKADYKNLLFIFKTDDSAGGRNLTCRNTSLQRARFPQIRIHQAEFGLGAFAPNDITEGRCLGEYVGELFYDNDIEALEVIQKHVKYNYSFELNRNITLDSHAIGNETRYLNHSDDPNCEAKVILVNGDQRIGIYTIKTIKQGEELLLDYGEKYWKLNQ